MDRYRIVVLTVSKAADFRYATTIYGRETRRLTFPRVSHICIRLDSTDNQKGKEEEDDAPLKAGQLLPFLRVNVTISKRKNQPANSSSHHKLC